MVCFRTDAAELSDKRGFVRALRLCCGEFEISRHLLYKPSKCEVNELLNMIYDVMCEYGKVYSWEE